MEFVPNRHDTRHLCTLLRQASSLSYVRDLNQTCASLIHRMQRLHTHTHSELGKYKITEKRFFSVCNFCAYVEWVEGNHTNSRAGTKKTTKKKFILLLNWTINGAHRFSAHSNSTVHVRETHTHGTRLDESTYHRRQIFPKSENENTFSYFMQCRKTLRLRVVFYREHAGPSHHTCRYASNEVVAQREKKIHHTQVQAHCHSTLGYMANGGQKKKYKIRHIIMRNGKDKDFFFFSCCCLSAQFSPRHLPSRIASCVWVAFCAGARYSLIPSIHRRRPKKNRKK